MKPALSLILHLVFNIYRLDDLTERNGITVDPDLHSEIVDIATENTSAIMERYDVYTHIHSE